MEKITISTVEEMGVFAQNLVTQLQTQNDTATVITLKGDLGAGKTTFVQKLALALGISEPVTSPTFVVMKKYQTSHERFSELVHMDAYRLEHESELVPLRFEELLQDPNTLICIEWPEKISQAIPEDVVSIAIQITEGETRTIQIEP